MSKERDRLKNNGKFPREKGKYLNSIGKQCDFLASYFSFALTEGVGVLCYVSLVSCLACLVLCVFSPLQVCECNAVSYELRNRTITCSNTLSSTHDCPIPVASRRSHYIHRP